MIAQKFLFLTRYFIPYPSLLILRTPATLFGGLPSYTSCLIFAFIHLLESNVQLFLQAAGFQGNPAIPLQASSRIGSSSPKQKYIPQNFISLKDCSRKIYLIALVSVLGQYEDGDCRTAIRLRS